MAPRRTAHPHLRPRPVGRPQGEASGFIKDATKWRLCDVAPRGRRTGSGTRNGDAAGSRSLCHSRPAGDGRPGMLVVGGRSVEATLQVPRRDGRVLDGAHLSGGEVTTSVCFTKRAGTLNVAGNCRTTASRCVDRSLRGSRCVRHRVGGQSTGRGNATASARMMFFGGHPSALRPGRPPH